MTTVEILRACSGTGKSTFANALVAGAEGLSSVIVSADRHMVDEAGAYAFDPARQGECHGKCKASFDEALAAGVDLIVVDNTNTRLWEFKEYAAAALAAGAVVKVTTILCDPAVAHARNTHGVALETVERQAASLRGSIPEVPAEWNHRVANA